MLTVSIRNKKATDQIRWKTPSVLSLDVVGIIGGSSAKLDLDYLRDWAEPLGLTELLDRAFRKQAMRIAIVQANENQYHRRRAGRNVFRNPDEEGRPRA